MKAPPTKNTLMGIADWLRHEQTFVAAFLRLKKASWFALNAATSTPDPKESVPSEQKLNA